MILQVPISEAVELNGKVKFLGWGSHVEASGILVSITKRLLDGYRLIVRVNAGEWMAEKENGLLKYRVENFGVGLRLVDIYALDEEVIEAVCEPIPDALPRLIYVNKGRQMSPRNTYVLATEFFTFDFSIWLYREDQEGCRTLIWNATFENREIITENQE